MKLAKRMLFNKRGSLYGAILAVTIGILVIHVNFVIFQGLYDAIVRDITEYRNGDVRVTDEDDYIDKSDSSIISWFERISYVEAAAPRLSSTAEMEIIKNGNLIEKTRIPVVGVDPFKDIRASTVHETVTEANLCFLKKFYCIGKYCSK